MATKLCSRVRPTISQPAAITNLDNMKILVSRLRGHRFQALKSNRTIAFDREVAPGIFTPSTPVPDDLAEEYRSVGGNLGVMVYGSLEREMTLAEIRSLQPDDPETVERDMRSIATRHPGKVFYDVARVAWSPIASHTLPPAARAELTRALGTSPSNTFINEVERVLGHYLWDREQVSNATPKKVRDRIAKVKEAIEALCGAIDNLQDSDYLLIQSAVNRELLKGRRTISQNKMRGLLMLYHRHITEAETRIARTIPKGGSKGTTLAYAKEVFAYGIAALLQAETGKRPTSTRARKNEGITHRGSTYTQVLTILLNSLPSESHKPRKDVEALARRALKSLPSGDG